MSRSNLGLVTAPLLGGVERLWQNRNLTINSQTVEPMLWFDGTGLDDTAKTWTCRKTGTVLSEAGAGTAPDLTVPSPHIGENGAQFKQGKGFQAGDNLFGDITTEDYVTEVVAKYLDTTGVYRWMFDKRESAAPNPGYAMYCHVTFARCILDIGASHVSSASVHSVDAYSHLMCFVDRSGSMQLYENGVANGPPVDISGLSASITSTAPFTVGHRVDGSLQGDQSIFLISMWKKASWLDTHLQATIAKERASLYFGHRALHGHGALTPSTL